MDKLIIYRFRTFLITLLKISFDGNLKVTIQTNSDVRGVFHANLTHFIRFAWRLVGKLMVG